MSSSDSSPGGRSSWQAIVLLLACGMLAGCGFRPLYATSSEDSAFDEQLASVHIEPISERIGQILANSLRDSFNPTGARVPERYTLNVVLSTATADYVIRKDGTASRELIVVSGRFTLNENGVHDPVLSGSIRINDSYDVGESPYSVVVSNSDAQTRAAQEISVDIRTRVSAYFRRQAKS
jgi:LPS-assembly lipoprotein